MSSFHFPAPSSALEIDDVALIAERSFSPQTRSFERPSTEPRQSESTPGIVMRTPRLRERRPCEPARSCLIWETRQDNQQSRIARAKAAPIIEKAMPTNGKEGSSAAKVAEYCHSRLRQVARTPNALATRRGQSNTEDRSSESPLRQPASTLRQTASTLEPLRSTHNNSQP